MQCPPLPPRQQANRQCLLRARLPPPQSMSLAVHRRCCSTATIQAGPPKPPTHRPALYLRPTPVTLIQLCQTWTPTPGCRGDRMSQACCCAPRRHPAQVDLPPQPGACDRVAVVVACGSCHRQYPQHHPLRWHWWDSGWCCGCHYRYRAGDTHGWLTKKVAASRTRGRASPLRCCRRRHPLRHSRPRPLLHSVQCPQLCTCVRVCAGLNGLPLSRRWQRRRPPRWRWSERRRCWVG